MINIDFNLPQVMLHLMFSTITAQTVPSCVRGQMSSSGFSWADVLTSHEWLL